MRPVIALFVVLFSCSGFAQQTSVHYFDIRDTKVSLNSKIGYIHVIDQRHVTDHIGYLREQGRRKQLLVTDSSLQVSLSNYVNANFAAVQGSDTLLFIIRSLYVEHEPNNAVTGTVYMQADFFRGSNNSYHLLYHTDSLCMVKPGNTRKGLLARFNELVNNRVTEALQDSLYNTSSTIYTTEGAIAIWDNEKAQYPLYSTKDYIRGVYKNWREMLMQTPSIIDFKMIYDEAYGVKTPWLYTEGQKRKLSDRIVQGTYYAIFDNGWYMSEDRIIQPVQFSNGDYYIDMMVAAKPPTATAIVTGVMFGMVGVGLLYGTNISNGRYLMKIDYKTGKLLPVRLLQ